MLVTPQNISDVIHKLNVVTTIALDTESSGLEETDKAFAVIVATETEEFYFDFRSVSNFVSYLHPILQQDNLTVIMQNAKFDIRMLASIGLTIGGKIIDIKSVARVVRNDHFEGGYSLAAQAKRELGRSKGDDIIKETIKKKGLFDTRRDYFGTHYDVPQYDKVPMDLMHTYACLDARLTYDLYKKYLPSLDQGSARVARLEAQLIPVCYKMERLGLRLDVGHTIKAMHHESSIVEINKDKYAKLTGTKFVNSAKSISKHLDYTLPLTEDGNPSLTDSVLESIITLGSPKDKEIADTVRLIRLYDKRVSTYYRSYLNLMDKNNIIHPTMHIAGTRTGRFSYSDPNLQNQPKEEDTEYHIRQCFIPRPGRKFVSIDYQAQEYRMMADYAGETELIKQVMSGKDLHQSTADMMGVTRKQAKTIAFLILYGGGDAKLADALGVDIYKAKSMRNKFFSVLPKVQLFVDNVIATGRSRGYVVNWLGRRLYADKEFCYALPNHLIQGGCADVMKKAMVEIDKFIQDKDISMVISVHDEIVFEVGEDCMKYIPDIQNIMENVYPSKNGMILKTSASYSSKSLASKDMEKYDRH